MATASEEPPGIQDASGNRKNVPSEGQSIGMSQAMKKTIGHRGIDPTGETTYKKNQLWLMAELKNVTLSAKYYVAAPHWSPDSETPTARGVYRCLSATLSFCQTRSSALKGAIQLGITHTVGSLSQKPERDVLLQDFEVVESIFFPNEGSNLTPAHHYGDFRFKTYAPVAFRYFRELFGIRPDDYMYSLCNESLIELSSSGASGSLFYLSSDDEFIIKTVQHKEAEFLQKLLPGYFMNLNQNRRTLLPKFYGLYCVQAAGKNIRIVVMNNLLPSPVQMHQKFDLKGSTYKRRASPKEKEKAVPTYKDLDFIQDMQEGILLEGDKYSAVCKTIQRDCLLLQSFKIMDYSLLVGIHNVDQACRAQASEEAEATRRPQVQKSLFSTAIEAIQAESGGVGSMDPEDQTGGIPARNAKGERLLVYMGIIDILQSYRFVKKLEHSWKALVHDGDTVSVHRPSFYADRFQKFMCSTVFRKMPTKTSPTKKRRANGLLRKTPSSGLTQTDTSNQMFPLQHLFSSDTVEDAEVNKVMQSGRPDILPLMPSPCNTEDDTPGSSASSSQVNSGFTPTTHPPSSPEEASVGVGGNQATLREQEQSTPERAQSALDESISAKDLP